MDEGAGLASLTVLGVEHCVSDISLSDVHGRVSGGLDMWDKGPGGVSESWGGEGWSSFKQSMSKMSASKTSFSCMFVLMSKEAGALGGPTKGVWAGEVSLGVSGVGVEAVRVEEEKDEGDGEWWRGKEK